MQPSLEFFFFLSNQKFLNIVCSGIVGAEKNPSYFFVNNMLIKMLIFPAGIQKKSSTKYTTFAETLPLIQKGLITLQNV